MLRTRVLSALILLPVVLGCLILGGWWFNGLILLVLSLAAFEFMSVAGRGNGSVSIPAGIVLVWLLLADRVWPQLELLPAGLAAVLVLGLVRATIAFNRGESNPVSGWATAVLAGLYIGWLGGNFIPLRSGSDGLSWSLAAILSTWLTDTGAYFIGRKWGKHKMASKLSPGKTWEGYLGGLAVATVSSPALAALLGLPVGHGLVIGMLVGAFSTVGDLGISMIKRQANAKDSGHLIPGHGGVLDRIDSLLISVALVTFYVHWFIG